MSESKCNSFVFIDLESTGLPHLEPGQKTRITEMCMISISRKHLLRTDGELPRTLNKISILFNPERVMSEEINTLTGLNNTNLEDELPFNEKKVAVLKHFLEQLKPPLCFVAHNGLRFDYPLLQDELKKFDQIIPNGTRCVDSLMAFRELAGRQSDCEQNGIFNPFITETEIECAEIAEDIEKQLAGKDEGDVRRTMELIRQLNETTPKSQIIEKQDTFQAPTTKRQLFTNDQKVPPQKMSYALKAVYARLFGCDQPNAHRAEDDTISLIKCCLKFGQPILSFFDQNNVDFSTIKPTYSY